MNTISNTTLMYRISTLIFVKNEADEILLLKRTKSPNKGCWSPPGGKLETDIAESPHQCAIRELEEETGHIVGLDDMHLFGMITEKAYEGNGHWLMFLFDCLKPISQLPEKIDEGRFQFFTREAIDHLQLPESDHHLLWPNYDKYKNSFFALRANCDPEKNLEIVVEESLCNLHNSSTTT